MKPLDGLTVVVTRAKTQASVLTNKLAALGAHAVSVATIAIVPPTDGGAALRAALRSGGYHQMVVTSPNGAKALVAAVTALADRGELDPAGLPLVACVGPSTAAVFADSAMTAGIVPDVAVAEGLVEAMSSPRRVGERLLLVQAEVARDVLATGLAEQGWMVDRVVAYRTVDAQVSAADRELARTGDLVLFTSSSTVERFVRLIGIDAMPPVVASIGPITSATAGELGVTVDIEADPHSIDGLIHAVTAWAAAR